MAEVLASPALARLPGVRHGFFTRRVGGGAGKESNSAAADAAAMAALGLPAAALCTVRQVHGAAVAMVATPGGDSERPAADGMVTATPDLALGVYTADCAPMLFADTGAVVIGVCHAGWRGALAGIADATVGAMVRLGATAERTVAVIGPTIAQPSYEVGPEFIATFLTETRDNQRFFAASERPDHYRFDLPGYLAARLKRLGLTEIVDLDRDTASDPALFHSYRRATLAGQQRCGRQLSAIALVAGS